MRSAYRLLLPCSLLCALACGDDGNSTTAVSATDTTTTGTTTGTTADDPTTGTTATSTGQPTTSTASTTTGDPGAACHQFDNESECGLAPGCQWSQVVGYTHGTQGCQGSIRDFCVPTDTSGGLTSMWKDEGGDIEVVQFDFLPTDLGPEWKVCDCDSPLACLCTAQPLDCPERLDEFCGLINGDAACRNAVAAGELVCSWFSVSPEGPADTMCTGDPQANTCLPATDVGLDTCDPITLPYPNCQSWTQPVYWRDVNGVVEVTTTCGPKPIGWTLCVADDPGQPEECKCRCL